MNWNDVISLSKNNPAPDKKIIKTDSEWKQQLTSEQYQVTRMHGTERPFTGEYCESLTAGLYNCVCCNTILFDSSQKFNSGTGWPSFTIPVEENAIHYRMDNNYGMQRVEVLCNVCDAHLGHVFPDGPKPSGLRFCINSASLKKAVANENNIIDSEKNTDVPISETATFGGGCFWCIEAIFEELEGVKQVVSGYAGGEKNNPTYREVCNGNTGHAEVVQITFDTSEISYSDLLRIFMVMHNPTTLNRQGADAGTQYRSIILHTTQAQQQTAQQVIAELQPFFDDRIVTEVVPLKEFYTAEESHQQYYTSNTEKPYCQAVINPKLKKLRESFGDKTKKRTGLVH